ncbi:DUF6198 family protein [uncultured Enorma sp.]|uniref:YczE/YyaS/YitT family protein n=1 Tax=uncultured Enorma sp. TaxID=1714346 RepID=UPI00280425D1|nr:DUF6198 family protein [uncultured Enorma sp.]
MRPLLVMGLDGVTIDWARTVLRMAMYLAGVVILALGMVVQTESGLGVASLTCFAQVIADILGTSLGSMITATYCTYIVAQALILRRQFQPRILLEVFFSAVIGIFTDFFMAVMPIHPEGLPAQVATMVFSLVLISFGVSLVVNMGVVPNAPDGLVQVISEKLRRRFGDVKVVFDTSHVVVALVLSWTVLHTIDAFGVTTVIAALFLGKFINVMNGLFAAKFQQTAFGSDRVAAAR